MTHADPEVMAVLARRRTQVALHMLHKGAGCTAGGAPCCLRHGSGRVLAGIASGLGVSASVDAVVCCGCMSDMYDAFMHEVPAEHELSAACSPDLPCDQSISHLAKWLRRHT
jgi:hypothetical protein